MMPILYPDTWIYAANLALIYSFLAAQRPEGSCAPRAPVAYCSSRLTVNCVIAAGGSRMRPPVLIQSANRIPVLDNFLPVLTAS